MFGDLGKAAAKLREQAEQQAEKLREQAEQAKLAAAEKAQALVDAAADSKLGEFAERAAGNVAQAAKEAVEEPHVDVLLREKNKRILALEAKVKSLTTKVAAVGAVGVRRAKNEQALLISARAQQTGAGPSASDVIG